MRDRAENGVTVGHPGQERQMLTDADSWHVGGDRPELAAVAAGCVRLKVEGLVLRWATPHEKLDAAPGTASARGRALGTASEKGRQREAAQADPADTEELPA